MKVFLSYAHDDADHAMRMGEAHAKIGGLEIADPERDHFPGDNWAGAVARALEESNAMVVLLTPAAVSSQNVKLNMEYALGAENYNNRLIPVVVGDEDAIPSDKIPWIVRDMPRYKLYDSDNVTPKIEPIAKAILRNT